ncbi:MAG: hypothetical protein PWR10_1311 [Halanaerobiales bacterium]|nr:hypothetical protein [Halanaerobiales bacterium]
MSLDKLKREFSELISYVDQMGGESSEEISAVLDNITVELGKLISKVKSVSRKKGISDSVKKMNQDAFLQSINHFRRENAYYELLGFEEAVKELKRVIAESTDSHVIASAYNGLGHIYAVRKHYEEALINFQKVVEFYPGYIDGYFNLGAIYFNLKMYDDAIREFNKVINMDHNDPEALLAISNAYKMRGDQEMSEYYYNQFSQLIS